MGYRSSYRTLSLAVLSVLLVGFSTEAIKQLNRPSFSKVDFLTREQVAFVRPGLQLTVQDVSVNNRTVAVVYRITDPQSLPLDRLGVFTPGAVSTNFVLAYLPPEPAGVPDYQALTLRQVTSPLTNVTTQQPGTDQGGTTEEIERGTYRYTFRTQLPAELDPSGTYSVGIYATRDLAEFDLGPFHANLVVNFNPASGQPQTVHDVVSNAACRQCHDPSIPDAAVEAHGGARQKIELCVLCHTPQLLDPDTGQPLDMKIMTHKIHMGEQLPSVQAGRPYQIIGFQQRTIDFSHVVFPQSIMNCQTCHGAGQEANEPGAPVQQEAFLLQPGMEACGSCHDDVNFATGESHHGIQVTSNAQCQTCHQPFGEHEFDASIQGAHTVVAASQQLEGINIQILDVTSSGPGQNPSVLFSMKNRAGQVITPSTLSFFNLLIAGPTTDYTTLISEPAATDSVAAGENFRYTFKAPIPANAAGTFAVGAEAYRNLMIDTGEPELAQVRETAENPVKYFAVTGEVQPRRVVVTDELCESCHENLAIHGGIRHNATEYCQFCHNPTATDASQRPAEQNPPQSIDLKFLVHRIHRGEQLTRDFTVFGFGRRPISFNEVLFPGDLRLCASCHVDQTYQVPSMGVVATTAPREFYSPIPPNSSACLGCHDTLDAAAHTFVNTSQFGESCGACHGPQGEFAVDKEHAR
ncbi:MAG: OmcA/MtrC family decaheme c-type cytochrome [Acidobacteriota bacterium]